MSYRARYRRRVRPEAMVAGDLHYCAERRCRRNAERISLALHDERRHSHGLELG
jgi:hypothetical protein